MKKYAFLLSALFLVFAVCSGAQAFSVTLDDFTGSDAGMLLTVTGTGTNQVRFDVQVLEPEFADIQGIFFNIAGADFSVFGDDVTGWLHSPQSVVDLGGGVNVNSNELPSDPFDMGVKIGTNGIGQDDIYSTTFFVTSSIPVSVGTDFAARLTSVGDDREGSSKLFGADATEPVPEPGTLFLLGLGVAGLAILRKKIGK